MKKFIFSIFLIFASMCSAKIVASGSTNVTTYVVFRDQATSVVDTGVTIANIDLYYTTEGAAQSAKADASALAAADSAHTDNGAYHVGNGVYRIDWPDAAFAGSNGTVVILTAIDGDGGAFNVNKEIEIGPPMMLANAAQSITSLTINNSGGVGLTVTGSTNGAVFTGSAGDGVQFTSGGGNGDGIQVTGNGTGEGIKVAAGATGTGIEVTAAGGSGVSFAGSSGTGLTIQGSTNGMTVSGTASSGLSITGGTNSDGVAISGSGTGDGLQITAGATGIGLNVIAAGGDSIYLNAGDDGIEISATGDDIVADFGAVTGITATSASDMATTVGAAPTPTKTKFAIASYIATTNSIENNIIAVRDVSDSNKISFGVIRSITSGGVVTLYDPLGFTPVASDLVYITGYQMQMSGSRYGRR